MPWFRFRKKKSSDDQRSDVPELEAKPSKLDQPKLTDPAARAAESDSTDPTKPKRRRGSRGGRGRKKPSSTAAGGATPERKEKAEPKLPKSRRREKATVGSQACEGNRQRPRPGVQK